MANEMKYCRKCGTQVSQDTKFCPNCGYQFLTEPQQMAPKAGFCQNCGKENASNAKFCRFCGTPIGAASPQLNPYAQGPRTAAPAKAKGKSGLAIKLIAAVLVLCILVTGFVKPGFFLKGSKEKKEPEAAAPALSGQVVSSEKASVSAESPVATVCGVTFDVDERMLQDGPRDVSVSVLEEGTDSDGSRYEAYELGIDGWVLLGVAFFAWSKKKYGKKFATLEIEFEEEDSKQ